MTRIEEIENAAGVAIKGVATWLKIPMNYLHLDNTMRSAERE